MEIKINIAELLKDCKKGMELYSPLFGDCKFVKVHDYEAEIIVELETGATVSFLTDGRYYDYPNAECILFPKGKTTWEGFQRPFKDGDILSYQNKDFKNRTIYIYMQHSRMNTTYYVALSGNSNSEFMINDKEGCALNNYNDSVRFATEEEKEKLFQAIKDNGYKWNDKTKTLEVLPNFKVGNKIKDKTSENIFTVIDIRDGVYILSCVNNVNDKFGCHVPFYLEKDYELISNKFDITNLKPFDKVLIRDKDTDKWNCQFFSYYYKNSDRPYVCIGCESLNEYKQCIPYEENKHLRGTSNDCDEYYKTW